MRRTFEIAVAAVLLVSVQGCRRAKTTHQAGAKPDAQSAVQAATPSPQPPPPPAPWLLAFDGKSTNELVLDKRFATFVRARVSSRPLVYWVADGRPTKPSDDVLEFLHGPPDDVHIVDKRYLTASACVPHDCVDTGLLWTDITTGATVFAASVYGTPVPIVGNRAHLWLFSNVALRASTLPPTLTAAIAQWSSAPAGDESHTVITDVTLVQPDGTQAALTPADVHAWQPTTNKPAGK